MRGQHHRRGNGAAAAIRAPGCRSLADRHAPRGSVAELVAEGFSRRLGRRVTVAETGLCRPGDTLPTHLAPWWGTDVSVDLTELAGPAPDRSGATAADVYRLDALAVPAWRQLVGRVPHLPRAREVTQISRAEIASAQWMLRLFSDADATRGGGYTRPALVGYLSSTVAAWLQARSGPAVRRGLFTVAARLSCLCGFTCFDDNLHGCAQGYYLAALKLAVEAGSATDYALTLRALSVQARRLGHHQQALELADTAVSHISGEIHPSTRASLYGQLAVARAYTGDVLGAGEQLAAAEQHLRRPDNGEPSIGSYHFASFAHQKAMIDVRQGDRDAAIRNLQNSISLRPWSERRSRAITTAMLAELQMDAGHLEAACASWLRFCDDYPHIRSGRADTALAALNARTRPFQRNPTVAALRHRAAELRESQVTR